MPMQEIGTPASMMRTRAAKASELMILISGWRFLAGLSVKCGAEGDVMRHINREYG